MSTSTGTPTDLVTVVERVRERPALDLKANLSVTVDGVDIAVTTDDDRLRVQVPSVLACVSVLSATPEEGLALPSALAAAGLTTEVRVGSAVVAIAGADAAPGRLARLLSVGPVEVRALALAAAAVRLR